MRIRLKKLDPKAVVPKYAHYGDAAVDLVATSRWEDKHGNLRLANSVGVIDSGYRGEIILKFDKQGPIDYLPGDRVAQLMLLKNPSIQFVEVPDLKSSDRDTGGFGSSGS